MTQCKHQVIDYFNGHIQGEEKAQFEEHLKHCSACKEELEELTSLMSDIPFLAGDQTPPAGMKHRILSQVFEEETAEEKNSHRKELKAVREQNEIKPLQKKRNQWLLPLVAALLLISAGRKRVFLIEWKRTGGRTCQGCSDKITGISRITKNNGCFLSD
nr:zf-HC2 domain-containing protein [Bacillus pumilus]